MIPELFEAACRFGRALRTGEAATAELGHEAPELGADGLLVHCLLKLEDAGAMPQLDSFMTPEAEARVWEW